MEKIAFIILILLVVCVACGFIATTPFATRGIEEVRIEAPRHLSEVYAGTDEIVVPIVWSGSESSETYAAVALPGEEPTILISRKVDTRDALKFYNAGIYQRLRTEGRVSLEVDFFTYKPAKVNLAPPDPVALALQVVLRQDPNGVYFTWLEGEVEVKTRINISVVAQPPKVRQVWMAEGPQPRLFVEVESYSQQVALQWATIKDGELLQGSPPFVPTEECGKTFCATFQLPLPPLQLNEKVATGFRLLDGAGFHSDYFLGWEIVGNEGRLSLKQLSESETRKLAESMSWQRGPKPKVNPPMVSKAVGQKPENPGVYQWLEEIITRIRGGLQ